MPNEIIFWVIIFVIAAIVVVIQSKKESKIANNGADKEEIKRIVGERIQNPDEFTNIFAYWSEDKVIGKSVHKTTWSYAMCFNETEVFLIPLTFGENTITGGDAIHLNVDNLSLVNGKDGYAWMSFYDKEGEEVVTLLVEAQLRKSDKKYVNLNQEEEFNECAKWIPRFMNMINTANGTTPTHKILKK